MRILVTTGGSREPIDDVRYVTNAASGRTGALIAEEAVRNFHTVYLLAGKGSVPPAQCTADTGLIVRREFGSAADLLHLCMEMDYRFDAILAAAAVADYAPVPHAGKLSSANSELVVRMAPTPKVVDRLRQRWPEAHLVAFKLESGLAEGDLFSRARSTMTRCGAELVVANDAAGMGADSHPAHVLDRDKVVATASGRRALARELIRILTDRCKP